MSYTKQTWNDNDPTTPVTAARLSYIETGIESAAAARRVVALTDGATITPNADTTDIGYVTLGGNRTMANPTGTPVEGQQLQLRIKQDGTGSRTITWGTAYRFSTDLAQPTLTTTLGKTDYLGFQYNGVDSKWDFIALTRGY